MEGQIGKQTRRAGLGLGFGNNWNQVLGCRWVRLAIFLLIAVRFPPQGRELMLPEFHIL